MPDMISLRTFALATRHGHTLQFEANTPRFVPDVVVADAMAAGCVPVNKDDAASFEDNRTIKAEFQGDIRRSVLLLVCKSLADENNSKHFNGGVPTREAVSERAGFDAGRAEIRDAWQTYVAAKNDGKTVDTHPQAQNVLRVVDARTKAELEALVAEFDVNIPNAKGLTVRELRSRLLSKFSGVVPG